MSSLSRLAENFSAIHNSETALAIRNVIGQIRDLVGCLACPECRQSICQSVRSPEWKITDMLRELSDKIRENIRKADQKSQDQLTA